MNHLLVDICAVNASVNTDGRSGSRIQVDQLLKEPLTLQLVFSRPLNGALLLLPRLRLSATVSPLAIVLRRFSETLFSTVVYVII